MKRNLIILLLSLFSFFFLFNCTTYSQPSIQGDYKVGDSLKCTIKILDNNKIRVFWFNAKGSSRLTYKEDVFETGESIWVEKIKEKAVGNFIFHTDFLTGKYVRFTDNFKADVIKIQ